MARGETIYRKVPIWAQTVLLNGYALRKELHGLGRPYREALERLLRQERWGMTELGAYQDQRIRDVVRIAYARSRYYREVMDAAGVRPADIRGRADLPKLPLLTRAVVRARITDLMTSRTPARGWAHGHTSGTTGSPLSIWYDRQTVIENNAQDRRQKIWGGMSQGDWIGMFLGRVVVPPGQQRPPYWRANVVQREVWFSSFHMSERSLPSYVAEIRRRGLRFLEGYPSTLFILATYLRRAGETLPMRSVFTSSETLHPVQREVIEEAFDCRLFDFYGMAERTIFAGECEAHGGRHLAEDFGYTEVVDEAGNPVPAGSWGYLVGTSLHNTAMPMIRYRTNDVSRILEETCLCGRTFRVLDPVTTKAEDVLMTPDGRLISPSILTHPFKPFDKLVKSQIIQVALDHVIVKLVAGSGFSAAQQAELIGGLQARLGSDVRIDVQVVDDIPPEKSGKFRWVISKVASPYSPAWDRLTAAEALPGAHEQAR
jgi:phenylacetate-CoA ligase